MSVELFLPYRNKCNNVAFNNYIAYLHGQFMFVIPSLKAVVVTNSSIADETAIRQAALITGRLFPELFKQLKK